MSNITRKTARPAAAPSAEELAWCETIHTAPKGSAAFEAAMEGLIAAALPYAQAMARNYAERFRIGSAAPFTRAALREACLSAAREAVVRAVYAWEPMGTEKKGHYEPFALYAGGCHVRRALSEVHYELRGLTVHEGRQADAALRTRGQALHVRLAELTKVIKTQATVEHLVIADALADGRLSFEAPVATSENGDALTLGDTTGTVDVDPFEASEKKAALEAVLTEHGLTSTHLAVICIISGLDGGPAIDASSKEGKARIASEAGIPTSALAGVLADIASIPQMREILISGL